MVTVWCSAACLIHYSFLNPGETITSEKYAQQIDVMHQKLQLLQLAFVKCNGFAKIQKAVVHQTGSRPPNSDHDLFRVQVWL